MATSREERIGLLAVVVFMLLLWQADDENEMDRLRGQVLLDEAHMLVLQHDVLRLRTAMPGERP